MSRADTTAWSAKRRTQPFGLRLGRHRPAAGRALAPGLPRWPLPCALAAPSGSLRATRLTTTASSGPAHGTASTAKQRSRCLHRHHRCTWHEHPRRSQIDYVMKANGATSRRDRACAPMPRGVGNPGRKPSLTQSAPSASMLAIIGTLRRPETSADRLPPRKIWNATHSTPPTYPDGTYAPVPGIDARHIRCARHRDGANYYLRCLIFREHLRRGMCGRLVVTIDGGRDLCRI
jgi:hypothetical protein